MNAPCIVLGVGGSIAAYKAALRNLEEEVRTFGAFPSHFLGLVGADGSWETYDGLLLQNLYGDIVSDLGAGLVGGLGVAPGANIGLECAMFEAVHGSAPDIAGKNLANPMAMILSAMMLLRYIEETAAATRIERAVETVLREKKYVTRDLGGNAGTREMTKAIVDKLK